MSEENTEIDIELPTVDENVNSEDNVNIEEPLIEDAEQENINADDIIDIDESEAEDDSEKDINDLPLPEPVRKSNKDYINNRILNKKDKELAKERLEKEELLRYVQQQQQLQQQNVNHEQVQNATADKKPERHEFQNEDEYIDARTQYNIDLRDKAKETQLQDQHRDRLKAQVAQKFEDMTERGTKKYSDYEEVIEPMYYGNDFPTNESMAAAIWNSEHDVDINYFLAKNITHAKKIAKLPPIQAQKKIWEIEQRFKDLKKKGKVTAKPKIIEPMSTSSGNHTKDISKMSKKQIDSLWENDRAQWNKLYKEQFKKKLY